MGNRPADNAGEPAEPVRNGMDESTTAPSTCQEEDQHKRGGMGELRGPRQQAGAEPDEEEEERLAGGEAGPRRSCTRRRRRARCLGGRNHADRGWRGRQG